MGKQIPTRSLAATGAAPGPGKRIRVVAGILQHGDQVLITDRRRSASMRDYWEFPGGKLKPGETTAVALERELDEELGVQVRDTEYLLTLEHDYPELAVRIDFFVVQRWLGEPAGREGQALRWVETRDLYKEKLLPADAPVVETLASLNKC